MLEERAGGGGGGGGGGGVFTSMSLCKGNHSQSMVNAIYMLLKAE